MGMIYLDCCLVIYAVKNDPLFGKPVRDLMMRFWSASIRHFAIGET